MCRHRVRHSLGRAWGGVPGGRAARRGERAWIGRVRRAQFRPRIVLSDEQKVAARAGASTELAFLFSRQEVTEENQLLFYHIGVTSIDKFATIGKDRDDLVEVLKDPLGA